MLDTAIADTVENQKSVVYIYFQVSQGSVVTYLWGDGHFVKNILRDFIRNLIAKTS